MPETNESQVNELLECAEQLETQVGQLRTQVEQLQLANSQLAAANKDLLAQVRQYAEPLISYGAGVLRVILNARSIKGMSLRQEIEVDAHGAEQHKGTYRVMIDDLPVTPYLPPEQAERDLMQAEKIWLQALQPPD